MVKLYQSALPEVFPHGLQMPTWQVERFVRALVDHSRTDVPNGSSFAVTVDAPEGMRNLWLSKVSYRYLQAAYNLDPLLEPKGKE